MKIFFAVLLASVAILFTPPIKASDATWDVGLCVGCTTEAQFFAAGVQLAGTNFNGYREILIINPESKISRYVDVFHTPPGEVPLGGGVPEVAGLALGEGLFFKVDTSEGIVFADELAPAKRFAANGNHSTRAPTADESAQRGNLGVLKR